MGKRLIILAAMLATALIAKADGINNQFQQGLSAGGSFGDGIFNPASGPPPPPPSRCLGALDLSQGCMIPGVGP